MPGCLLHPGESSSALADHTRTREKSLQWGQGAPLLWAHSDLSCRWGLSRKEVKDIPKQVHRSIQLLFLSILHISPPSRIPDWPQPPCRRKHGDFFGKLFKWTWLVSRAKAVPKPWNLWRPEAQIKKAMQIGPLASSNENQMRSSS